MKKIWLILLSLGLIMAFSVSAFAVDVKVSAEYYAGGLYLNKVTVDDGFENWQGDRGSEQPSTAFFFQRLRMGTDFIVSPCLKLVTRFDAMERIWGGARSSGDGGIIGDSDDDDYYVPLANSAGTRAENENIAFDLVYIDYTAPIGQFKVGYQKDYVWGTIFADRGEGNPAGQIQYWKSFGPVTVFAGYAKEVENNYSATHTGGLFDSTITDRDADSYRIAGIYNFQGGEAGALFRWERNATARDFMFFNYNSNVFVFDPYIKAKIGPVNIQAEAQYWFGNAMKFEETPIWGGMPPMSDVSISALSVFVDATANFGVFNVGGSFAYLSGDDPGTTDKLEGSGRPFAINTGGLDWNPCLILFNTDLNYWAGNIYGHGHSLNNPFLSNATVVNSEMSNAWFFQGRVGVKPTPQLDVQLAVSFAQADKKPAYYYTMMGFWGPYQAQPGGTYGTEIDLTGTYKITNNLTYMLGVGYLFTGDYFKGVDVWGDSMGGAKVNDDFILINKLILTF
jgi:hypothetical protein